MADPKNEFVTKNIFYSDENALKLISPFSCFICGFSGSGKSVTCLKWLQNADRVFQNKYTHIYYFYGSVFQKIFKTVKNVQFSNDLKLLEKIISKKHPAPGVLVVLDDLLDVVGNSGLIERLYTKGSHHHNIDIINIVQNIFYKSRFFVTLKENTHYYYIKQFINEGKIKLLANTVGVNSTELMQAYVESSNKNRFEGLLIDNHISSDIRKITKIRDKIHTLSPGLYITNEKFEYFSQKKVITPIGNDQYFLNTKLLKDSECR